MDALLPSLKIKSPDYLPSIHVIKKPYCSSPPLPQMYKVGDYSCLRLERQNGELGVLKCAKSGIVPELEDGIEVEEEFLKEKCRESDGIAELLECLEKEAIMGDDEGRDATDYNRRAQIFDKSSRVFQAIKQRDGQE